MKLSYTWLQSYFVKKLPKPEQLAELLTFRTVEVESIEKVQTPSQTPPRRGGGADWVLSLDVLPNRAHDLNSHLGVAKEIAVLTGLRITNKELRITEDKRRRTSDILSVRIEDADACPRYIGRYVEGVTVKPSPKWMRERLEACGMRAINNVVDTTNYVMLEYGQPLHAFDAENVKSMEFPISKSPLPNKKGKVIRNVNKEIIVRRASKGEKFTTLDDQDFTLDGSELLIADEVKPLALAGIKGGKFPGISEKTTSVILEAANFNAASIRRTARKLNLVTDSGKQFSGGLHPVLAERAMERLCLLIQEIAGGSVYTGAVDIFPGKGTSSPIRIAFSPADCARLIGMSISVTEMKNTLRSLRCDVDQKTDTVKPFLVTVPQERLDLTTPEDLYEEVGRIYGWERVPASSPLSVIASAGEEAVYGTGELARKMLTGAGYSEHAGYTFISRRIADIFRHQGVFSAEIANPLNEGATHLRPTMLASLVPAIAENAKRRDAVRLFELGKTFTHTDDGRTRERWSLGIASYRKKESRPHEAWYDLKGVAETLLDAFGIHGRVFTGVSNASYPWYAASSVASIHADEMLLGTIAEVALGEDTPFTLDGTAAYVEFEVTALMTAGEKEREFSEIPKFPSVVRDIAVVVSKGTTVEQVQNVIEREGGEFLWDADLFDVYEGKSVGEGRESIAFQLVFQSPERTLRDEEIEHVMQKVVAVLKEKGWEVR